MNVHALTGVRALRYFAGVVPGGPGNTTAAAAVAFNAAIQAFPEAVLAGADFPDFMCVECMHAEWAERLQQSYER